MIHKIILLYILIVSIFISGCEKKEHPIAKQTDSVSVSVVEESSAIQSSQPVSGNFVEHENIICEEKMQEVSIFNEPKEKAQVQLILKRSPLSRRSERIEYVDWDATELYFFKCSIIGIEGLAQLKSLETIVFNRCSDLQDFSFLTKVPNLKRLFIEYITQNINWNFIEELPYLEVLYIDSYFRPTINIDLINNRNLEYIGITSGDLETFPTLYNIPISLKYLNLESNKISSLPTAINIPIQTIVLLGINPFVKDEKTSANITVEFASSVVLEQKYHMLINRPHITDVNN